MQGFTKDMSPEFLKLEQLLSENQFEWLPDGRVVYLMNDAVESFLVFENARMTGNFDSDYRGVLSADMEQVEDGYLLVVRQGEKNTFTVRFTALRLDVALYQKYPKKWMGRLLGKYIAKEKWDLTTNKSVNKSMSGQVHVSVLREEPFVETPDALSYKVYFMRVECKGRKKVIEVEQAEL